MKPLSERSKAVLASYRGTHALPDRTRRRALAGLHARIAASAAPPAGIDVTPPEPVSQGFVAQWLAGPLAKIGVGIVLLAIPAAFLLSRGSTTGVDSGKKTKSVHVEAIAQSHSASTPASPVQAGTGYSQKELPVSPTTAPDRAVTSDARKPQTRLATPPAAPRIVLDEEEEESAAATDTIDEEVALLSRAHAALRAGRPAEALSRLREHARRFPNSKLADSREATRILALCASGQKARARTEAERFLAAHPGSAFTSRIRSVCEQ